MAVEISLLCAIVILILVLVLTIFGYLIYSGLFEPVVISAGKPPFNNLVIAYKYNTGPYKNAGSLFTECYNLAPKLRCIGVFYDDPKEIEEEDLRYVVGSIISEGEESKEEDKENLKMMTSNGFKIAQLPSVSHSINVRFPFKNTLSIFLAVWKVYPKLGEYIKEKGLCAHPMIELYEDDVIHFVAPLAKQDEFYLPEALVSTEEGDATEAESEEVEIEEENLIVDLGSGDNKDAQLLPEPESREDSTSNGEESAGSSFEELTGEN